MIGLNVGSGQRRFDTKYGWTNIDIQTKHPPNVLGDMFRLPIRSDIVNYVVSHHTIEHLGCGEADEFVREAQRVLVPGGSLLVFVPNLRALAQRWLMGQLDDFLYMANVYGAYQGDEADRHKWGYDPRTLVDYLEKIGGWKGVKVFDWRTIPGADIARDWWILGVEAVK